MNSQIIRRRYMASAEQKINLTLGNSSSTPSGITVTAPTTSKVIYVYNNGVVLTDDRMELTVNNMSLGNFSYTFDKSKGKITCSFSQNAGANGSTRYARIKVQFKDEYTETYLYQDKETFSLKSGTKEVEKDACSLSINQITYNWSNLTPGTYSYPAVGSSVNIAVGNSVYVNGTLTLGAFYVGNCGTEWIYTVGHVDIDKTISIGRHVAYISSTEKDGVVYRQLGNYGNISSDGLSEVFSLRENSNIPLKINYHFSYPKYDYGSTQGSANLPWDSTLRLYGIFYPDNGKGTSATFYMYNYGISFIYNYDSSNKITITNVYGDLPAASISASSHTITLRENDYVIS